MIILGLTKSMSPVATIKRVLRSFGMDEQTIKFWTAVSAFETDGWKSRVYRDSSNLFNLIVPGKSKLNYGEGQTVYSTSAGSAQDLIMHVIKPFKYSANYQSLDDLVTDMKSKGYFTSDETSYLTGVKKWYAKLFPHE